MTVCLQNVHGGTLAHSPHKDPSSARLALGRPSPAGMAATPPALSPTHAAQKSQPCLLLRIPSSPNGALAPPDRGNAKRGGRGAGLGEQPPTQPPGGGAAGPPGCKVVPWCWAESPRPGHLPPVCASQLTEHRPCTGSCTAHTTAHRRGSPTVPLTDEKEGDAPLSQDVNSGLPAPGPGPQMSQGCPCAKGGGERDQGARRSRPPRA